ncbi:putative TLD family protein isoform X1 [Zea mays]|nr:putative TLD family protein isoform X1 [Zea mays]|eukprot:XP_008667368.1 putative TLD family protein isoform X1 [Zea mays]
MGASSSTGNPSPEAHEQREQETLASAALSLPLLRAAFSRSAANALPDALAPPPASFRLPGSPAPPPPHFHGILGGLGPAIASQFFGHGAAAVTDGGAGWVQFLRGFNRCCARVTASRSLALLLRVYAAACAGAGAPCGVQLQPDEGGGDEDGKVVGELAPEEIAVFLWVCWVMAWSASASRVVSDGGDKSEPVTVLLPDVTHLVLSALVSAGVVTDDAGVWGWDVSSGGKGVKVQEFMSWVLSTPFGLGNCLSRYVRDKFRSLAADSVEQESSVSTVSTTFDTSDVYLLTRGRAWAIALSLRNKLSEKLLSASVIGMDTEDLLYRSSVHGKGLSRFWSCVEGYKGPMLILLSAFSKGGGENVDSDRRWVIGVLTEEGFENKDTFYGSSGFLCAAHPIFRMLPPSGKEKNFMYCHLHPQIRAYEANPKPVGLAFGGTIGNERIFLDEDFSGVLVRHHAVDKTYQHGSLIPNQGYLPVEASVLDVEVWGLGGEATKRQQNMYKKREDIFSEQRRKVDLKTFASWEDSPEKMMMDMMSDPNTVRREDR